MAWDKQTLQKHRPFALTSTCGTHSTPPATYPLRADPKRKTIPFHSITQPIAKTKHYSNKRFLQSHGRNEQGNDTRRATDGKLSTSVTGFTAGAAAGVGVGVGAGAGAGASAGGDFHVGRAGGRGSSSVGLLFLLDWCA